MSKVRRKGAEQARSELPALLADAANGRPTIITRYGRSIAAIVVPVGSLQPQGCQIPMAALAGSGKGLWGKDSSRTVRKLRDEWSR